jgi:predicted nucleic acid-binding Zn ribbon protein
MRRRNTEQLGEVIRKFLRQEGLETPLNQYRLVEAWKDVVGTGIANYTQQIYIKNQTLWVHLTSPVLRQELMMTRQILVRRLNEKVGAQVITDIVFR